jgi:serine/threonine protein kinase
MDMTPNDWMLADGNDGPVVPQRPAPEQTSRATRTQHRKAEDPPPFHARPHRSVAGLSPATRPLAAEQVSRYPGPMDNSRFLCAQCHSPTTRADACDACGADPRLEGRYTLLEAIGQGAVGTTYRALDPEANVVAVKELLVRRLDTFKTEELFHREAAVLKSLSHPSIPRYLDHFIAGTGRQTGYYLVVEFIDGETIAAATARRRPTEDEVLDILEEAAQTLAYLHDVRPPVVHRDIKPANLMRHRDGRLMLIDFGAVREVTREAEGGSTVAGTFGYMAPEQFAGIAEPTSDLYSLGVVAIELLSGRPPQALITEDNRLAWRDAVSGIAPGFRYILDRLLEPNRQKRLPSARALLDLIAEQRAGRLHVPETQDESPKPAVARAAEGIFGQSLESLKALAARINGAPDIPLKPLGPPPPPAPRRIPWGFASRVVPGFSVMVLVGLLFGGIGLGISIAGIAGVEFTDANSGKPVGATFPVLFGLVFFAVGAGVGLSSVVKWRRRARAYRDGLATVGRVVDITRDISTKVNGRSPWLIEVEFEANGVITRASKSIMGRLDYGVGQEVHVLYATEKPEAFIVYPIG